MGSNTTGIGVGRATGHHQHLDRHFVRLLAKIAGTVPLHVDKIAVQAECGDHAPVADQPAPVSRGFQVTPISATNLREVAAMRCLSESHALRESFEAGDIDWEGDVVAAHRKLAAIEQCMRGGKRADVQLWKRYDREFHRALIWAGGSQVLLENHALIYDRHLRYQMVAALYGGELAGGEHLLLRECALKRDWKRAQSTLTKHVQNCVSQMIFKRMVT